MPPPVTRAILPSSLKSLEAIAGDDDGGEWDKSDGVSSVGESRFGPWGHVTMFARGIFGPIVLHS